MSNSVAPVARETILTALRAALEPLDYTYAMWEGGAAAFGRVDEWSDIDVQIDVDDDRVEDAFAVIEETLQTLSPIELKYRVPEPTWHGHSQAFYRLRDASPFLLVDTAIMKHSSADKFLAREIHGQAVFHFDKSNLSSPQAFDWGGLKTRLRDRLAALRVTFEMFQILTLKELHRGNLLEALAFYHGYTLRPLVELLRIHYGPARHGFHTHYVYYDLPREVAQRLERLFLVTNGEEIRRKRGAAEAWFYEVLDRIDLEEMGSPE